MIEVIEDIQTVLPLYKLDSDGKIRTKAKLKQRGKKLTSESQLLFLEGAEEIYSEKKRQKRSSKLRSEAIKRFGYSCYVCDFNFEDFYKEYGEGYIEMHHLEPLANAKGERETTIDEVRVVCSNCHSVLHRQGKKPISIEELRMFIKAKRQMME